MYANLRLTITALFLIFSFSIYAFAQGTTGSIEGTVSDVTGEGISGATIKLENSINTTGFQKTVIANENGYFHIDGLLSGNYKITIFANGFETAYEEVQVLIDKITQKTIKLYVAMSSGDRFGSDIITQLDKRNSQTDKNIPKETIEDLPRETTFTSVLKYAPNVRPEPLAGGFQIDGGSGSENVFVIDGQEVSNYRTGLLNTNNNLPIEFLQEVQVKSTGFEAEYQGATGGVVNIVTNGGNNSWHGNFGFSFSPNSLDGESRPILNRYGGNSGEIEFFTPSKDKGTDYFPVASINGPIVNNKLWFSGIYAPQIFNTKRTIDYFSTGSNPANRTVSQTIEYEAQTRTEFAFMRLDSQPVTNLRLFGTFLWNPIIQDGTLPSNLEGFAGSPQQIDFGVNGGVLTGAELLSRRGGRQNSNTINGQVSWHASKNLLINFRAGRNFLNEKLDSYLQPKQTRFLCSSSGNPENYPGSNCSRGFQNIGSNYYRDFDTSIRNTFDADASLFGVSLAGQHNFKFGYQFNRLFNEKDEGYSDTGFVVLYYGRPLENLINLPSTAGNLGSGFIQRSGEQGEASSTNQALYAQDSWQIANRLTLNLGVRFENEDFPEYLINTDINFGWKDKISPRVGAAFDLLGNGKTKIFGSFGWFYDRLKFDFPQTFGAGVFTRDYFEILPTRGADYSNYTFENVIGNNSNDYPPQCPLTNGTAWSVCRTGFNVPSNLPIIFPVAPFIDPSLKPTRQSDFTVGFEREIDINLFLAGRFTHKQLDNVIEDIGVFNNQGIEITGTTNPGSGIICENAASSLFSRCAEAERKYDAFEVLIDKRSWNYFFNANYTWSRLFGNYSGLASSDESGRVAPNITRSFDLPNAGFDANGNPDNGRLATDRPHVFKSFGGYIFDWQDNGVNQTTVSAFTTLQSGTPTTTVYSLYSVRNSILFERGDLGRTEAFSETDLFVKHRYKFGTDKRFSIVPYIQIQNLFDEQNELAIQTSISSTNFTSNILSNSGCTTCTTQADVYNTIFNLGGIQQFVTNHLNNQGTSNLGQRNDYGQPTLYQSPRNIRFGFRFLF